MDELVHLNRRMRATALQSTGGGMALSMIGMFLATTRPLSPQRSAITQPVIDVLAIPNAPRAAFPPKNSYTTGNTRASAPVGLRPIEGPTGCA